MSFILDALRKSEHERQRSATPGLSQVPLATPQPRTPRWMLAVMGVLVAAVLVLGAAWWRSSRAPEPAATVERSVELPPPASRTAPPQQAAPTRMAPRESSSLSSAAASTAAAPETGAGAIPSRQPEPSSAPRSEPLGGAGAPALPSAAALAAGGVMLAPL